MAELSRRLEVAAFLHAVQKRVERSCAEFVPVTAELSDHVQSEDGLLGRVVKNMQPNQS